MNHSLKCGSLVSFNLNDNMYQPANMEKWLKSNTFKDHKCECQS